jgi:hypothetical protein
MHRRVQANRYEPRHYLYERKVHEEDGSYTLTNLQRADGGEWTAGWNIAPGQRLGQGLVIMNTDSRQNVLVSATGMAGATSRDLSVNVAVPISLAAAASGHPPYQLGAGWPDNSAQPDGTGEDYHHADLLLGSGRAGGDGWTYSGIEVNGETLDVSTLIATDDGRRRNWRVVNRWGDNPPAGGEDFERAIKYAGGAAPAVSAHVAWPNTDAPMAFELHYRPHKQAGQVTGWFIDWHTGGSALSFPDPASDPDGWDESSDVDGSESVRLSIPGPGPGRRVAGNFFIVAKSRADWGCDFRVELSDITVNNAPLQGDLAGLAAPHPEEGGYHYLASLRDEESEELRITGNATLVNSAADPCARADMGMEIHFYLHDVEYPFYADYLTPASGPAGGSGGWVNIFGSGFPVDCSVTFGGLQVAGRDLHYRSSGWIKVRPPAHPEGRGEMVNVFVHDNVTGQRSNPLTYTYTP